MPELTTYLAFIATAAVIVASPGPSVLFVVARSIELGTVGGLRSVVGVALGALCHAIAVSLGLATLLQASPMALEAVKHLGCVYLVYLGVRTLRSKPVPADAVIESRSSRGIVWQGLLVELLNPKTALFFLAFLPQFAAPARGAYATQLLVLGLTFVAVGVISDGIYAAAAGRLRGWLQRSAAFRKGEKYFSGSVYCGLGVAGFFSRVAKSA